MALNREKLVFFDCQTTGMHPSLGYLLEVAWVLPGGAARSFLLRLPEGEEIPARVQDITSITEEMMNEAVDPEIALAALETDLEEIGSGALLVAHYAQFERAFLEAWFEERRGKKELPARLLCTYKIARKLFPEAPSRNIRALTGYFELGTGELRRAAHHAAATAAIWHHLEPQLAERGLGSPEELDRWLAEKTRKAPVKIEYRIDRFKRLELPDQPGVYRMLGKAGQVLYVGKATSLKSRVNSYFRGQKNRDRRKLEMLAQVWDIETTVCASPLEAALLENEEIKRLNPPYNVSLKAGRRKLVFYSRDLRAASLTQDDQHPVGPFSLSNAIEFLISWVKGLENQEPAQIFFGELEREVLETGFWIFCAQHGLDPGAIPSVRQLLALGLWLKRAEDRLAREESAEEEAEEETAEADEPAEETPATPEEVAEWFRGLMLRAAFEYQRAQKLTRLLNARVKVAGRALEVRGGKIWHEGDPRPPAGPHPWAGLDLVDYDRMSVLLTEVVRHAYPVETLPPLC